MSEIESKGQRGPRDSGSDSGQPDSAASFGQDIDRLRQMAALRRREARQPTVHGEIDEAAGNAGMVVDDREAQVKRVTKALVTKNDNTRKAVAHGLQGAKDSILSDLINEQLPGSAIQTFGRSFFEWIKDKSMDFVKDAIEVPLGAAIKIIDPIHEAIGGYEEKKEILFSAEVAKKLIADLTITTDAQLDGIRDSIFGLGDEALQRLDGLIDTNPLVEAGMVAAQVRLLFEEIVLPHLSVRDQVNRIHHLAENAIDAGEQTERTYQRGKKP